MTINQVYVFYCSGRYSDDGNGDESHYVMSINPMIMLFLVLMIDLL